MTGQHFLIVHDEPDDGMDVEHPADCPTELIYDGMGKIYTCGVGQLDYGLGLGLFFRRDQAETADDWQTEYCPPGRYEIEYWTETSRNYTGAEEFDCGLALVKGGAADA